MSRGGDTEEKVASPGPKCTMRHPRNCKLVHCVLPTLSIDCGVVEIASILSRTTDAVSAPLRYLTGMIGTRQWRDMKHAISVEHDADPDIPDLLTLRCTCGEHAKGRLIDVLVMWAEWHLRVSDPEFNARTHLQFVSDAMSSRSLGRPI